MNWPPFTSLSKLLYWNTIGTPRLDCKSLLSPTQKIPPQPFHHLQLILTYKLCNNLAYAEGGRVMEAGLVKKVSEFVDQT
jgi:hypothetical protein